MRNNDVKLLGHRDMLLLRYVIVDTQCIINRSDELNPRLIVVEGYLPNSFQLHQMYLEFQHHLLL